MPVPPSGLCLPHGDTASVHRFCNNELADWKSHLTPEELKPEVSKVQPIMVVYFEGQIHRIPVKQGPDGLTEFTTKIRYVLVATATLSCCCWCSEQHFCLFTA